MIGTTTEMPPQFEQLLERVNTSDNLQFKPCKGEPFPDDSSARYLLLKGLISRDPALFLERYGKHLTLEDLHVFDYWQQWKDDYEVKWHIQALQRALGKEPTKQTKTKKEIQKENKTEKRKGNKQKIIKNRRYTALQELISNSDHFSDSNLQASYPYLYHLYIGRYKGDKDNMYTKDTPLSARLLINMDQADQLAQRKKEEEELEEMEEEDEEDEDEEEEEEEEEEEGQEEEQEEEMEEEEENRQDKKTGEIVQQNKNTKQSKVEDNRQQFMDVVYQKFLAGEDKDFDYTKVDNNDALDPASVDQDYESDYFDDDDDDDDSDNNNNNNDTDNGDRDGDQPMSGLGEGEYDY